MPPEPVAPAPVIVFDTDCVLCAACAHFVLRFEAAPDFRFVSAWSDEGLRLAGEFGFTRADLDQTFLVLRDGEALARSDAALSIVAKMRAPMRWLAGLRILPRALRDPVYNLVARHRYRLFGQKNQCFLPKAEHQHRFTPGPARGER